MRRVSFRGEIESWGGGGEKDLSQQSERLTCAYPQPEGKVRRVRELKEKEMERQRMKAGKREKLRQWIVKKRAEGRSGGGRALGVRNVGVHAEGVREWLSFPFLH